MAISQAGFNRCGEVSRMLIADRRNLTFNEMECVGCIAYPAGARPAVTPRFGSHRHHGDVYPRQLLLAWLPVKARALEMRRAESDPNAIIPSWVATDGIGNQFLDRLLQFGVTGVTVFSAPYGDSSFGLCVRADSDSTSITGSSNNAMLKGLIGLLGKTPRNDSAQKPVPRATAPSAPAGQGYRAVSVALGIKCCLAAKNGLGKSYLARDAPRLPLMNCTMPANCSCKFKKASDRRDSERREAGTSETGRWFAGPENRTRGRRKSSKS
jgi:hypothetical protein